MAHSQFRTFIFLISVCGFFFLLFESLNSLILGFTTNRKRTIRSSLLKEKVLLQGKRIFIYFMFIYRFISPFPQPYRTDLRFDKIVTSNLKVLDISYLLLRIQDIQVAILTGSISCHQTGRQKSNKLLYTQWELFRESNFVQTDTSST